MSYKRVPRNNNPSKFWCLFRSRDGPYIYIFFFPGDFLVKCLLVVALQLIDGDGCSNFPNTSYHSRHARTHACMHAKELLTRSLLLICSQFFYCLLWLLSRSPCMCRLPLCVGCLCWPNTSYGIMLLNYARRLYMQLSFKIVSNFQPKFWVMLHGAQLWYIWSGFACFAEHFIWGRRWHFPWTG
jgi:hypothetical protein